MLGIKQQRLVDIGKLKGFITLKDVRVLYTRRVDALSVMAVLMMQNYFTESIDKHGMIVWKYINEQDPMVNTRE